MDIKIAQQETITELVFENQKLKQERDEWRKSAFEITEQATKSRKELERERDEWRKKFELSVDAVEIAARLARSESERDEARADAAQLADRLSGLELRTTEELAKMEQSRDEWAAMCGRYKQERDEANQKLKIATEQWELCIDLAKKYQQERDEWKDMAAKLVNIASYALGEFDVQLTLDQQRTITETMRQYHSLLKKK